MFTDRPQPLVAYLLAIGGADARDDFCRNQVVFQYLDGRPSLLTPSKKCAPPWKLLGSRRR
jgi:hypothetical protein